MKVPCQRIVWDVLPAIRSALAADLVKNGMPQQDVANILETTPSSVSQYLSGKRGYRIEFDESIMERIAELGRDIRNGNVTDITARICAICHEIRGEPATPCVYGQEPSCHRSPAQSPPSR